MEAWASLPGHPAFPSDLHCLSQAHSHLGSQLPSAPREPWQGPPGAAACQSIPTSPEGHAGGVLEPGRLGEPPGTGEERKWERREEDGRGQTTGAGHASVIRHPSAPGGRGRRVPGVSSAWENQQDPVPKHKIAKGLAVLHCKGKDPGSTPAP